MPSIKRNLRNLDVLVLTVLATAMVTHLSATRPIESACPCEAAAPFLRDAPKGVRWVPGTIGSPGVWEVTDGHDVVVLDREGTELLEVRFEGS